MSLSLQIFYKASVISLRQEPHLQYQNANFNVTGKRCTNSIINTHGSDTWLHNFQDDRSRLLVFKNMSRHTQNTRPRHVSQVSHFTNNITCKNSTLLEATDKVVLHWGKLKTEVLGGRRAYKTWSTIAALSAVLWYVQGGGLHQWSKWRATFLMEWWQRCGLYIIWTEHSQLSEDDTNYDHTPSEKPRC